MIITTPELDRLESFLTASVMSPCTESTPFKEAIQKRNKLLHDLADSQGIDVKLIVRARLGITI